MAEDTGNARYFMDCRQMPSDNNCSLYIAGRKDEVFKVAVRHAVEDHRDEDTPELREQIRSSLQEEKATI